MEMEIRVGTVIRVDVRRGPGAVIRRAQVLRGEIDLPMLPFHGNRIVCEERRTRKGTRTKGNEDPSGRDITEPADSQKQRLHSLVRDRGVWVLSCHRDDSRDHYGRNAEGGRDAA